MPDAQGLPRRGQERGVDVEGLIDRRRAGGAHRHLDLLVVDRLKPVAKHLKGYWVDHDMTSRAGRRGHHSSTGCLGPRCGGWEL